MELLLILPSTIPGCVSISAFASLFGIHLGIASSVLGSEICAITAEFKKCKSLITKKRHSKIVLLAKAKLNSIEVLISKDLIDPYISNKELFSVNNVLKEYSDMKEAIKNLRSINSDNL